MEGIVSLIIIAPFIIFLFLIFKFWFEMLIDCLTRPLNRFPSGNTFEKLFWCLVILFGQLMGAIVYYLALKRNDPYYAFFEENTE